MPDQPSLPTEDDLKKLPLLAIVAYAVRCARRAQPILDTIPSFATHGAAVEQTISLAERFCLGHDVMPAAAHEAMYNAAGAADLAGWAAADAARAAAFAAAHAAEAVKYADDEADDAAITAADAEAEAEAYAADWSPFSPESARRQKTSLYVPCRTKLTCALDRASRSCRMDGDVVLDQLPAHSDPVMSSNQLDERSVP